MGYVLRYFNDELAPGSRATLSACRRIVYVFAGTATVNGAKLQQGGACYADGPCTIVVGRDGAMMFRWDLAPAGTVELSVEGDDTASTLRMAREIWSLQIASGSRWLFRLDFIDNPAGVVADVHTHPGPGIRALLSGTFDVRQPSEDGRGRQPGDPWWESGVEAVISTPSRTQSSSFLRCMILPVEYEGRPDTAKWLRTVPAARADWRLLVDAFVTL